MKLGQLDTRNITNANKTDRTASTASSLRVRSSLKAGAIDYQAGVYHRAINYVG